MSDYELEEDVIKIGTGTGAKDAASVIARSVLANHTPKIRAIGAGAVNQAAKACAIARGYVAPRGVDLVFIIGFDDVVGDNGDTISAMTITPRLL